MANISTEIHVDSANPGGWLHGLEAWLEHMTSLGHSIEQAQVTHDPGTPEARVTHLVGGAETTGDTRPLEASEPAAAEHGAAAEAEAPPATAP